ncbi:MAG TPA: DUF4286 family protein [Patescibacteria group bacterium]|nr:DUF4286 family protein [Patescibacteria group bacterium]
MILYSVAVTIPSEIAEEWLRWMLDLHIPDVMKTGMFTRFKIFKNRAFDVSGETEFCTQYEAESFKNYELYRTEFAPELQRHHTEKFGTVAKARRMVLEEIIQ